MDEVQVPPCLERLSREDLVFLSKRINPEWGVSAGKWSRSRLIDRVRTWSNQRQTAVVAQQPQDVKFSDVLMVPAGGGEASSGELQKSAFVVVADVVKVAAAIDDASSVAPDGHRRAVIGGGDTDDLPITHVLLRPPKRGRTSVNWQPASQSCTLMYNLRPSGSC